MSVPRYFFSLPFVLKVWLRCRCTACGERTWQGVLAVIVGISIIIALATRVKSWYNYFTFIQDILGAIEELNVKALSKIIVALGQIVGGLAEQLNVKFPTVF
eukprot:SAG11_NODE_4431_length_1897_cov_2.688543_3_plen_101_part_01